MIAPRDYITELKPAPTKWFLILLGSLALAVGGAFVIRGGAVISLFMGFLAMAFGICGILVSLTALFSERMVLRLTSEGFGFGTLRRKHFYKWSDIAVFGVGSVTQRRTCFTLREGYAGEERIRSINRGSIGFERFLPDTYGKKPMELAKLLEDWRHRYSDIKHTELP
jgi:hypothetical protein